MQRWREAHSWYRRSLDIYLDLRNRSSLASGERNQPDAIANEIAKCDAAIAKSNHK
jgi:hypothetical protein